VDPPRLVILGPTNANPGPSSSAVSSGGGGTNIQWAGVWDAGTNYGVYQLVSYSGNTYLSIVTGNGNNEPDTSPDFWFDISGAGNASTGIMLFNVVDYGAIGGGSHDDTEGIDAADAAARAVNGGVVYFPINVYLYKGSLILPTTTTQTAYAPGSPPIMQSAPVRWTGLISNANPRGDLPVPPATLPPGQPLGPIILWDPPEQSTFITGLGSGVFEFDNISVYDISPYSNLWFRFTNTVFKLHDFTACGNSAGTAAQTDFLACGYLGAATPNGGTDAIFQGYGSYAENINLQQMRYLVCLCSANQVKVSNCVVGDTCGWSATTGLTGFDFPAAICCSNASGNFFDDNDIELCWATPADIFTTPWPTNGYEYAEYYANGSNNNRSTNNFWDGAIPTNLGGPGAGTISAQYFDATSYDNRWDGTICQYQGQGFQTLPFLPWGSGPGITNNPPPGLPIGCTTDWYGPYDLVPAGYFLTDGDTFNEIQYPQLYAALGNSNVLPNTVGFFTLGQSPVTGAPTFGEPGVHGGSTEIITANLPAMGVTMTVTSPDGYGIVMGGFDGSDAGLGETGAAYVYGTAYASGIVNPSGFTEAYWPNYITGYKLMRGV